jgi:hypothetical protein
MIVTNKEKIDLAPAVWLLEDDYDYNDDPYTISATTLIQPLKPLVMAAQNTLAPTDGEVLQKSVDVIDMIGSRMGSALHDSLEQVWRKIDKVQAAMRLLGYPDHVISNIRINPKKGDELVNPNIIPVYIENRSSRRHNIWTISGKYDLVINGQVEDYKSGSVWGYIFDSNRKNYILQLSIYKWLNPSIITDDKGKIHYMFTDWSKTKAKQDKGYPQTRIITKEYVLLSLDDTERFVREKLADIERLIAVDQDALPSCTPEDLWQKDSVWKYYKNPLKKARSTANFDEEGPAYTRWQDDGEQGEVVHHPGEVVRCRYCNMSPICNQAAGYVQSGLLQLED